MSNQANKLIRLPRRFQWWLRRISASQRSLPNCYIVGAQKAGTSSLYHHLVQHPQVHQSFLKEIHYFDGGIKPSINTYNNGQQWYRAHFALKHQLSAGDICLDATPMYLFNPQVAQRIKQTTPNAKIIILLRNPTERAISHYFHSQRHHFETLDIAAAMTQESVRLSAAIHDKQYKALSYRVHSYQARGMYVKQIETYRQHFSPKQLLILNSEEFFSQPNKILNKVFEFLNIDQAHQIPNVKSQNVGNNKTQVPPEVYQQLNETFKQANEQLYRHLGQRYDW